MTLSAESKIIATLTPSPVRRYLGTGMMLVLGVVLIYIALDGRSPSLSVLLVFAGLGLVAFLVAYRMHMATANSLLLRADGIHSSDGTVVAKVGNILRVERGLFAFKPSNGFVIILKEPMDRAWNPGLWWRFSRRVGIGGVTPQAEGKIMAERLSLLSHPPG